jgi:tetratricopeptide (TPR) repeat protein
MQDEIARAVARALQVRLRPAGVAHPNPSATTPEAYDAYLRGIYRFYRTYPRVAGAPELEEAIRMFEQAVARDPDFALAHAMLARAYAQRFFYKDSSREWQEKAFVEVEKALALDPDLAEGYLARGDLTWTRESRFPHEAAMKDYRRALELNVNLVSARWEIARIYQHVGLFDRALAELEEAKRLDPKDPSVVDRRGKVLVYQRDYHGALESFEAAATPNTERAMALAGAGRTEEAREFLSQYLREHPDEPDGHAYRALMLARAGEGRRAREAIARAARLDRGQSHMHHSQYYIGAAYSVMGEATQAVEWLQRAASEGFPCYPFFLTDPDLKPLAKDERFLAFLSRLRNRWEQHKASL